MLLWLRLAEEDWFGWGYAVAAYAVIAVTFFGYLAWLHAKERRVRRRLDDLEAIAARRGDGLGA
jgi:hypothetical protein